MSPAPGPWIASSTAAASRTDRVITLCTLTRLSSPSGPSVVRPRDTFSPTQPHMLAGVRIDTPPSLAWATGKSPAATAAALPPLDTPGVSARFHWLWVASCDTCLDVDTYA